MGSMKDRHREETFSLSSLKRLATRSMEYTKRQESNVRESGDFR
jgi:hypothetical protein